MVICQLRVFCWRLVFGITGALACLGIAWAEDPLPSQRAAHRLLSIEELDRVAGDADPSVRWQSYRVDLKPAQWIWWPSQRTLPNTFVLFRREINLTSRPRKAIGWITADSRYRLTVNGQRVQWGPAPCDHRHLDVDPVDLTALLKTGKNVIGVEVLFYGHVEGTWVAGKPGMICNLSIETEDGRQERIVSDASWQAMVDRAHRPGQYRRWLTRALQEEFDARLHPHGWDTPGFVPDNRWLPAYVLPGCSADKPAICGAYSDYHIHEFVVTDSSKFDLRKRQVPQMLEREVPVKSLSESGRVRWSRDPADWFDFRVPNSFEFDRTAIAAPAGENAWELPAGRDEREAVHAIFEMEDEIVGFPHFTVDAPQGTVIEMIWQESHDPRNAPWLDTYYYHWARFVCREGVNRFEVFDYEAVKWIQLHVRNHARPVKISNVGMRQRLYDWPHQPHVKCSEPDLQRLFGACLNTLNNLSQGTFQADAARERQQYLAGADTGKPLDATRWAYGETRLSRRHLLDASMGVTAAGYMLDSWPSSDRLERLWTKEIDLSHWGSTILDSNLTFVGICWDYYMDTGDAAALKEVFPRLMGMFGYFEKQRGADGLLPVENIGLPTVWMDHCAYQMQRHKQCAYNLLAGVRLGRNLRDIAVVVGDQRQAQRCEKMGNEILSSAIDKFWSPEEGLFINNRPWLHEEKTPRMDDQSLEWALLFDLCPGGRVNNVVSALVNCPPNLGMSYMANYYWRYSALLKYGHTDIVLKELREKWANQPSVKLNNTLSEHFDVRPDSIDEWSHNAIAPLCVLFPYIAGIQPLTPGYERARIRPQLGDLGDLELTFHTPKGPIEFHATRDKDGHQVVIALPSGCEGELVVANPLAGFESLGPDALPGLSRYRLPAGKESRFHVVAGPVPTPSPSPGAR